MFAKRTDWDIRDHGLSVAAAERRAAGRDVLDLTETNPTRCAFDILNTIPDLRLADAARCYSPDPLGMRSAREAVCGYYAERACHLSPERIVLASGTSEAYGHAFQLLLNPGETLLAPGPSYPLLDVLAPLHDVQLATYPLHYDGRWWLDVDALRAAISPSTRAIVVIAPNNPTGSRLSPPEREAVLDLARAHQLAVIVDEVFTDYRWDGGDDDAATWASAAGVLTLTLNGVSKTLAMPQMKLAWTIVGGDPSLAADACRRLEIIADAYLSVGTPVQLALPNWLARRAPIQAAIRERLDTNRRAVQACRAVTALQADGGWSAVIRVPATRPGAAWARELVMRDGVLVDPGSLYGLPDAGALVVSLLPPAAVFEEGICRLDARMSA